MTVLDQWSVVHRPEESSGFHSQLYSPDDERQMVAFMRLRNGMEPPIFVQMYYTYIITNPGKTVFYTGITNNIQRRMKEHRDARGTKKSFAGKYYCYLLVYLETFKKPSEAIAREKEIKN